jgi:hypothetical protein
MAAVALAVALLGTALTASDTPSQVTRVGSWLDREGRLQGRIGAMVESQRRRGFSGAVLVVRRRRPVFSRSRRLGAAGFGFRSSSIRAPAATVA